MPFLLDGKHMSAWTLSSGSQDMPLTPSVIGLLIVGASPNAAPQSLTYFSWQVRARCAELEAVSAAADMRAEALTQRVAGAEERLRALARQKAEADACCEVRAT